MLCKFFFLKNDATSQRGDYAHEEQFMQSIVCSVMTPECPDYIETVMNIFVSKMIKSLKI